MAAFDNLYERNDAVDSAIETLGKLNHILTTLPKNKRTALVKACRAIVTKSDDFEKRMGNRKQS
jgi:hypothetical protein